MRTRAYTCVPVVSSLLLAMPPAPPCHAASGSIARCRMVDYWDRTHLARMRARRPHSQDSDGSMILHFAPGLASYPARRSQLDSNHVTGAEDKIPTPAGGMPHPLPDPGGRRMVAVVVAMSAEVDRIVGGDLEQGEDADPMRY